jgi:hypothetical protein
MAGETINRIGLAVGVDDPGNAALAYLTSYNDQLERAERLTRQLNAVSARVSTVRGTDRMGQLLREEQRERDQARRREETADETDTRRRAQRTRSAAREEVVTKEQVVRQLDALSARSAETQKRRATDVTNHTITEGRRAADAIAQLQAKSTQELSNLYGTLKAAGPAYDVQSGRVQEILAQRMAVENPYVPGGPRDPNSAAGRATLAEIDRRKAEYVRAAIPSTAAAAPDAGLRAALDRLQGRRQAERTQEEQALRDVTAAEIRRRRTGAEFALPSAPQPAGPADPRGAFLGVLQRSQGQRLARQLDEQTRVAETLTRGQEAFQGVLARGRQVELARLRDTLPQRLGQAQLAELRTGLDQLQARRGGPRDELEQYRRDTIAAELRRRRYALPYNEGGERAERTRTALASLDEYERAAELRRNPPPPPPPPRPRETDEEVRERRARETQERSRANEERVRNAEREGARAELEAEIARESTRLRGRAIKAAARSQLGLGEKPEETFGEAYDRTATGEAARLRQRILTHAARSQMAQEEPFDAEKATAQVGRLTDGLARMRKETESIGAKRFGTRVGEDARALQARIDQTSQRVVALRRELETGGRGRAASEIQRDMAAADQSVNHLRADLRHLREEQARAPRYQPPGGPGGPRFGGDDPYSAVSTTGRIARNLILYTVIRAFTQDLGQFVVASTEAARVAERTEKQLEFTSKAAHVTFEGNLRVAQSLRDTINISGQQSQQITAEATRFAARAGQRDQVSAITRAAADLAAARGFENAKIPQLLDTLTRGERGIEEIIGRRPEEIYEESARRSIRSRPDLDSLQVGKRERRDYQTEAQGVRAYVEALSEEQKAQLILNEYLRVANTVQGAGEARARSLEGQIERTRARWEDFSVTAGRFILSFRPAVDLLTRANNALEALDPGKLRLLGSGAGGRITDLDVSEYGRRVANSPVTRAQQHLESYGPLEALGVVGAVGGFFGGRSPARVQVAQQTAERVFDRTFAATANQALAQTEASAAAQAARPGIVRSIGTGFVRVTTAVSGAVLDLLSWAAERVGAEGVSARSTALAGRLREGAQAPIGTAQRAAANYAAAGGVAGAVIGAQVGSLIADKLNVGPITATALTITGAIVGTAIGTAAGSALGSAVVGSGVGGAVAGIGTAALAGATAVGVAGGIAVSFLADAVIQSINEGSARRGIVNAWDDLLDQVTGATTKRRAQVEAEAKAGAEQAAQRAQAAAEGRLYYVRNRPESPQKLFYSEEEYRDEIKAGLYDESDFVVSTAGGGRRYMNTRADYNRGNILSKAEYDAAVREGRAGPGDYRERIFSDDELSESRAVTASGNALLGDRTAADKMWADIRKKEEAEHQELINRTSAALGRLRETVAGSVRLVEEIGQTSAGPNNPFVKIFADGATAAERMRVQWGHLGPEVVDVFTRLEQRRVGFARIAADFDNLRRGQDLTNKREREEAERGQPGLNRVESAQLSVQQAIVAAARELPDLARKYREVMGGTTNQVEFVTEQAARLLAYTGRRGIRGEGDNVPGFSFGPQTASQVIGPDGRVLLGENGRPLTTSLDAGRQNDYALANRNRLEFQGLSPRARVEAERVTQGALADILEQLSPAQLRANPGLRSLYVGALNFKARDAQRRIEEEISKATFEAGQQDRLTGNLAEADTRRRAALGRGEDAREVGRQFDLYLIGRTEGISPRDLTDEQARQRDAALEREAERTALEKEEAERGVREGLEAQKAVAGIAGEIRDLLLDGLASGQFSEVLVRVENDAQARADVQDLEDAGGGGYRTPRPKTSRGGSYGGSYTRYGKKD